MLASATLSTLFDPVFNREDANTCFCLHLISFLVNSHKPDPADLENDEKAECWGPEGMKGDGGGPRGGHMTQGRQRLKASPLSPCSGPVLEGSGDFLPPPTRPTDVERSPVPRDRDTTTCCFPACRRGLWSQTEQLHNHSPKSWAQSGARFQPTLHFCSKKTVWAKLDGSEKEPCLSLCSLRGL